MANSTTATSKFTATVQSIQADQAVVTLSPIISTIDEEPETRKLLALANDIVDKQYRLYSWNDAKTLSLITTNSVLFAAVGFLFKDCLSDALALICISLAFAFLGTSLYFSLAQVIPQQSSGKTGADPNVRSLRGILTFKSHSEYHQYFEKQTTQTVLRDATRQIYGMAHNNDESRKTTTKGVRLTLIGVIFIMLAAASTALSSRDINLLGKWAPDKIQKIEVVPAASGKTLVPSPTLTEKREDAVQPPSVTKSPSPSAPKQQTPEAQPAKQ